jgi:hypothetical protein
VLSNMARRLADLSDRELAPLFNMTIAEVRRYRQPSTGPFAEAMAELMSEAEKAQSERHSEWLWNLSVEEFRALRESNDPNADKPSVREVPIDVAGRFRALQELLRSQGEFESRYPAAFEILFPRVARRRERVGLHLPSFGVRILNNWIYPHIERQDTFSGADAHTSVSRWWQKDWRLYEANRLIDGPGLDDLQGVLLAILSREEDGERAGFLHFSFPPEVDGVQTPEVMPIRLTDLRLADLFQSGALQQGIRPILDLLHRPSSAEHVVLWKLGVLGGELRPDIEQPEPVAKYLKKIPPGEMPEAAAKYVEEMRKLYGQDGIYRSFPIEPLSYPVRAKCDLLTQQFGDEETGIAAVSFAAAALWLFLDLDTPGVERASSHRLAEQVESLASVIRKLTRRLRRSSEDLGRLTANRSSGALSELPGNNHIALQNYRLGHYNLRQTAEWLGITPYSSKTGKGTRDWKARVIQRLQEGKEFEYKNYPRAAAIFASSDHPVVRRKARRAYRGYQYEVGRGGVCSFSLLGYWAQVSAAETKRGKEIAFAYLQLGSCILQRIPPIQ